MSVLVIHFARYGPYHHARLRAAHEVLSPLGWEVIGLEIAGNDATYAWDEIKGEADGPKVITAFPGRVYEEISAAEFRQTLKPLLDSLKPTAMAIAGWGSTDAVTCLSWCRKNDVRRIVMSETRAADGHRVWWKELAKRYFISRFDAALVGGKSHRDYLVSLGMKHERIVFGYNVVDNAYFSDKTQEYKTHDVRKEERNQVSDSSFPLSEFPFSAFLPKYFLASNRFIERKNLVRLLEAYARYVDGYRLEGKGSQDEDTRGLGPGNSNHETECDSLTSTINNQKSSIINQSPTPWHLCLLGDGEQKPALIAKCHELGLVVMECAPWETAEKSTINNQQSSIVHQSLPSIPQSNPNHGVVWMPGFRQISELPRFYAHAGCFVHPALEEPWGLVINEAMASGLPVLSGDNVGAAEELLEDGVNGWVFDARNVAEMAAAMTRLAGMEPAKRRAMREASVEILEQRCPTAAFGRGLGELLQVVG